MRIVPSGGLNEMSAPATHMLHRSCSWPGGYMVKTVPWDAQATLSQTPICFSPPPLLPLDGWPCNQQGSAAQKEPPHQTAVRSRSVNQRLVIAGTLPCPGSQPRLAPSVPGFWRRSRAAKVGSHWPAAPFRPYGPDLGPETDPSHCSLDMIEAFCNLSVWTYTVKCKPHIFICIRKKTKGE